MFSTLLLAAKIAGGVALTWFAMNWQFVRHGSVMPGLTLFSKFTIGLPAAGLLVSAIKDIITLVS